VYVHVSEAKRLSVIASTCTHSGCAVHWKADDSHYTCPCHESQFDAEGVPTVEGQKAKEALIRLGVTVADGDDGTVIEVDPLSEFYEDEWEDPEAFIDLTATS